MSSGIKEFCSANIQKANKKFVEHKSAFNTDNIGTPKHDYSFHVLIGPCVVNAKHHSVIDETYSVAVKMFFNSKADARISLANALEVAGEVRSILCAPASYRNTGIKSVICQSSESSEEPTNGSSFVIDQVYSIKQLRQL